MLSEITAFAVMLRRAGIKVSMSEVRDFLEAVSLAGVHMEGFLWAMEAALIKQESDRPALERLFELFWHRHRRGLKNVKSSHHYPELPPRLEKAEFQRRMQSLKDFMRNERQALSEDSRAGCGPASGASGRRTGRPGAGEGAREQSVPERFVSLILEGDREKMRALVRTAMDMLPGLEMDDREFFRQMGIITGWAEGGKILRRMSGQGALADWGAVDEGLLLFREIVAAERDRALWKREPERVLRGLNAAQTYFSRLDYDQSLEIRRKLVMLGKRLAARKSYRYAASPRGVVDLRRTAALAGRHGGVPVKLLMRDKKPSRPEIVILCDLSGSVASFSRFMLLLVSAMQDKFRSTRSFAFVDAVEEVTPLIGGWDAERKIAEILRHTGIRQTGFSDYGAVWRQFEGSFLEVIGDKTTLVILGDARNNYKPDGIDHFIKIAKRARRVIWLNPAPAETWNSEDGIMKTYAPHCTAVLECGNLEQLEKVVRHVFN
ncbi:MAG: VWA domain-containing protein [Bacillota bacterium]